MSTEFVNEYLRDNNIRIHALLEKNELILRLETGSENKYSEICTICFPSPLTPLILNLFLTNICKQTKEETNVSKNDKSDSFCSGD